MRILLTGGQGFLGNKLRQLASAKGLIVVENPGDIMGLARFTDAVDVICHLAAKHGSETPRAELMRTNVVGTQTVIEYARVRRTPIVFLSSSAVYKSPESAEKITEEYACEPRNDYGLSKLMAEQLLRNSELPVTVLRLFNVYGPGQRRDHLISQMIAAIKSSQPFRLATPNSVRDFIYLEDTTRAILAALVHRPTAGLAVYNLGTDTGTTLIDLYRALAKQYKIGGELIEESKAAGSSTTNFFVADSRAFRQQFDWQPKWSLAEGLKTL